MGSLPSPLHASPASNTLVPNSTKQGLSSPNIPTSPSPCHPHTLGPCSMFWPHTVSQCKLAPRRRWGQRLHGLHTLSPRQWGCDVCIRLFVQLLQLFLFTFNFFFFFKFLILRVYKNNREFCLRRSSENNLILSEKGARMGIPPNSPKWKLRLFWVSQVNDSYTAVHSDLSA